MIGRKALTGFLLAVVAAASFVPCTLATDGIVQTSEADFTEARLFKRKPFTGRPKIGFALGGGGTRGGAHIGVLKVLDEAGIKPDYIVGTSIGAITGAFYAAGVTPAAMAKEFEDGKVMKHFMTMPLWFRIVMAPIIFIPRIFGANDYDGLYKGSSFRKYLVNGLPADEHNIENLKIPFGAVALNLLDGRPYIIKKGNLGMALQATSAVPALRKPVPFDKYLFVDGGVDSNLPVKQCREMGADFVIAVNIDENFKEVPEKVFRKPGSVTKRMILWGLYEIDAPQEMMADVVIHPNTDGISLISTKKSDCKSSIASGEEAARKLLPEIKAKLAELNAQQQ